MMLSRDMVMMSSFYRNTHKNHLSTALSDDVYRLQALLMVLVVRGSANDVVVHNCGGNVAMTIVDGIWFWIVL